jgi:hypothetical protein
MKSSGGSSTNIRVEEFETADHMIFCVWQGVSSTGNGSLLSQTKDSIWEGVQILSFYLPPVSLTAT